MRQTDRSEPEEEGSPSQSHDDLSARLGKLDEELRRHRPVNGTNGKGSKGASDYGQALRLSSEFIAAIVVGGAIGWFLDGWLGFSPWGMIIFLLLGFVAGILNVLRSAGLVSQPGARNGQNDRGSL